MILEKQKEVEVFTEGEQSESIAMSLDMESMHMLMSMLSKNLYADEIGSPIRELASNALDSHRRAKVDKPIIVSLKRNAQYNWEFTVEDMGIGLDHADVEEIISKYGKSLAREEEDALGLMGLGFKSPLAYAPAFYFVARKNGVERKYMMYEGEEGNMIDLLYEQSTTKGDGVMVILPVKSYDVSQFVSKIKEQLAYFEGVYFDVPGLDNSFKILRAEHFQQSEMSVDKSLHICLDNVYYPIDFNKLGIPQINIPLGLRFGLKDGIYPVPSRESIRYTPIAKAKILEKIRDVANYMVSKYNETAGTEATVQQMIDFYTTADRAVTVGTQLMGINDLLKYATVKMVQPKIKGVNLLSLSRVANMMGYLVSEYTIAYMIKYGKMSERKRGDSLAMWELTRGAYDDYYIYSGKMTAIMRDYLKYLVGSNKQAMLVRRVRHYKLGSKNTLSYDNYYRILELGSYPKWKWRQVIKEWQLIQSMLFQDFKDVDKIVVPQDWIDNRKTQKILNPGKKSGRGAYVRLQGEAVGKLAVDLERSMWGQNCKFVPETIKFQDLDKYKGLTVYTDHDHCKDLDPLYHICNGTQHKIRCITFSNREVKNIQQVEVHNVMTFKKFMEGNNKLFKRLVTAYLIYKLMKDYGNTFAKKEFLKTISKHLYDKLVALQGYKEKYYKNPHEEIYDAMLEVANAGNLFDGSMYGTYLEVKTIFEKHPFVEPVLSVAGSRYSNYGNMNAKDVDKILCDLFKYYKFRIDYENYKKPEPKPVIEVAEEPIEELDSTVVIDAESLFTDEEEEEISEEQLEDQVA